MVALQGRDGRVDVSKAKLLSLFSFFPPIVEADNSLKEREILIEVFPWPSFGPCSVEHIL